MILARVGILRLRPTLSMQIVGLTLIVAVLGGGTVGLVVSDHARATLKQDVNDRLLSSAEYAASVTDNYIDNARAESRELASEPVMQIAADAGNLSWTTAELERWQIVHPDVAAEVVDSEGVLVATSLPDKRLVGQRLASAPDWLPGTMASVNPYLGAPDRSETTQIPRVPYAVRMTDRLGNVRGVLVASISLQALTDRLSAIAAGPNARTMVVDLDNDIVLSHPDTTRILSPRAIHNDAVSMFQPGQHHVVEVTAINGEPMLSAATALKTVHWVVMVNQPTADAFAPVEAMTRVTLELVAALLLAALTVGTLLALRVVRPVRRLRDTAEAMASGDLAQRTGLRRGDEIGRLAASFDHMADQLEATILRANEGEARVRAVMDHVADGIITFDERGQIDGCNPAAERLFGYPEPKLIGLSIEKLLPGYPDREQEGHREDGTVVPLEVSISETSASGRRRFIVVARDISERRQIERQREEFARSEHFRALGQMASGIAHAALEDTDVVKRLQQFTHAPSDELRESFDLTTVVREAVQLTAIRWRDEAQAEGRPISLLIQTDTLREPVVTGSPARLEEALTNLINNAVDALPGGGNIRVRVTADQGEAIVEVIDSGVGMSPELQERIFEPFFTTKGTAGAGLGLVTVFGVVEQHGGRIEVHSVLGAGSTFRIRLPLAAEQLGSASSRAA